MQHLQKIGGGVFFLFGARSLQPGWEPGSILSQKSNVNWRRDFDNVPGGSEAARRRINLENDNVVRELVLRQQVFAARIDGKVPRLLATCWNACYERERPLRRIDRKNRDTIVSAIRGVQKLAAGMNFNLGCIVPRRKCPLWWFQKRLWLSRVRLGRTETA